jgi:hypothetical protein
MMMMVIITMMSLVMLVGREVSAEDWVTVTLTAF